MDIDQCAFGRLWKTTTRLAFVCRRDADFGKLGTAKCKGKGGWCGYNRAYHVQLSGDPRFVRVATTKQAQAYPIPMAEAIVRALLSRQPSIGAFKAFTRWTFA